MKILLTNDDGFSAEGLQSLLVELEKDHEVYVLAPDTEKSGKSHAITLKENLYVKSMGKNKYSCTGFPVDCVYLACAEFFKDIKFDLVISGINRDANLGQDHFYSGTVGAAREAVFRGHKAISVSLVLNTDKENIKYDTAIKLIIELINHNIDQYLGYLTVLNINVPNIKFSELRGFVLAPLGFRHYSDEVTKLKDDANNECYQITGSFQRPKIYDGTTDCELIYESFATATCLRLVNESSRNEKKIEETLHDISQRLPFNQKT